MKKSFLLFLTLLFFLSPPWDFSQGAPSADISNRDTNMTQAVDKERTKNPYQVTGESLVLLITRMVDFSKQGSSIVFERRSGQLFVKQSPVAHALIENILKELRRAAFRQVEIEARFVTVSSQNFKGLGVDFAGLNAALSKAGFVFGTAAMGTILAPAAGSFSGTSFLDFPDVTGFGTTPLGQQLSFVTRSSKVDFKTVYDALETLGEVNTLSAPKITVFNNQRAHIRIEKVENYVGKLDSSFVSQTTVGGAATTPVVNTEAEINQARSGTLLDVTPTVNQDKTITLELHPQFVSADLSNTQSITNVTGGARFANTVTLPVFKSQTIDTTITVPDGGFAVMGGLIQDTDDKDYQYVPGLGKVPYVKRLFSNEQVKRTKSYLLIFVQAKEKGYRDVEKQNV